MENRKQHKGMNSVPDTSLFSNVLFVTAAALLAGAALYLLPTVRMPQMVLHQAVHFAPALMVLGFSGVLVSTLLNLPDATRRTLVLLFPTALVCSGFVALVMWFGVSGASGCWL
jgi:VIT1/CCC1 family predicted Fe2+/Mn2+ transporter